MIKLLISVLGLVLILQAMPSRAEEDSAGCQNVRVNGGPAVRLRVKINNPVSRYTKAGEIIGTITYENSAFRCFNVLSVNWNLSVSPNMPYSSGGAGCAPYDFPSLVFNFTVPCNRPIELATIIGYTNYGGVAFYFPDRRIATITAASSGFHPPGPGVNYQLDLSRFKTNGVFTIAVEGDTTIHFSDPQMQIYFPQSPLTPPTVDLGLANGPGKTLSGIRQLDMCLYDGHDSTSPLISLTFQDEGASAAGRLPGTFSVYRQGSDKSKPTDRLDYALSIVNPVTGATEAVTEGKEFYWRGMNNRGIQRRVALPGVPGLTYCVPAPLTLKTPAFKANGKNAGHYTGVLKVIYRIPTIG